LQGGGGLQGEDADVITGRKGLKGQPGEKGPEGIRDKTYFQIMLITLFVKVMLGCPEYPAL